MISAGAPPQTPLGELTALSDPLAVFKGPTSKGKEGKGEERRGREGEGKAKGRGGGRGREGKEGEGRTTLHTPLTNSWLHHWFKYREGS